MQGVRDACMQAKPRQRALQSKEELFDVKTLLRMRLLVYCDTFRTFCSCSRHGFSLFCFACRRCVCTDARSSRMEAAEVVPFEILKDCNKAYCHQYMFPVLGSALFSSTFSSVARWNYFKLIPVNPRLTSIPRSIERVPSSDPSGSKRKYS